MGRVNLHLGLTLRGQMCLVLFDLAGNKVRSTPGLISVKKVINYGHLSKLFPLKLEHAHKQQLILAVELLLFEHTCMLK